MSVDRSVDRKLTAIIPTRDRPLTLRRAVDSVLRQTVAVEIVVVDDGSSTPVSLHDLPANALLVRHESARGPARARNAGVERAETEWVGFLDDDDIWLPQKAELVLRAASSYPDANVIYHAVANNPRRSKFSLKPVLAPVKRVLYRQPPHLSGVAVRRRVHDGVLFDETMWATQDIDYLIRLAAHPPWAEVGAVLTVHGGKPPEGSAIELKSRIEGRLSLLERHGQLILNDQRAHAFFLTRLGHQYRRDDQIAEAQRCFTQALGLRPTSVVAWKGLARTLLMRVRA